ncbi:hypothetical protein BDM02DRAFT_3130408 [Thelephora ganbajun]|uniref:Uncharacterized protein n=1 Tax=Thelephora ganbajun TaxID=370292 RepID=A0ACB6ZAG3_THEGA|nr:hypothetical protein BDM02DRAFT_3130408 [Thelephora ganbajun]
MRIAAASTVEVVDRYRLRLGMGRRRPVNVFKQENHWGRHDYTYRLEDERNGTSGRRKKFCFFRGAGSTRGGVDKPIKKRARFLRSYKFATCTKQYPWTHKELSGPRPLCRVMGGAKLGYWYPSRMDTDVPILRIVTHYSAVKSEIDPVTHQAAPAFDNLRVSERCIIVIPDRVIVLELYQMTLASRRCGSSLSVVLREVSALELE